MEFKGTAEEIYDAIAEYFEKKGENKIFSLLLSEKVTKQMKSRAQERTYYKLMNAISEHLGYNVQEVKMFMLAGVFGTKKYKSASGMTMELPIRMQTRTLEKVEAILFIDSLIEFCKMKDVPVEITPREIQSLYDSYD